MPGAWVMRARLHAADGAPMPTKQTSPALSAREAAMIIISAGVAALMGSSRGIGDGAGARPDREVGRGPGEDVDLHPGQEAVAVPRDRVPGDVIGVVAAVVAMGVGGERAA